MISHTKTTEQGDGCQLVEIDQLSETEVTGKFLQSQGPLGRWGKRQTTNHGIHRQQTPSANA
jgi:hypothetical protein